MQAATDSRDRGRRRGAAVARHGCGGCCACRPPRRGGFVQLVGDRADGATAGKIGDWVGRQLR
jgi:hypothetical protein